ANRRDPHRSLERPRWGGLRLALLAPRTCPGDGRPRRHGPGVARARADPRGTRLAMVLGMKPIASGAVVGVGRCLPRVGSTFRSNPRPPTNMDRAAIVAVSAADAGALL